MSSPMPDTLSIDLRREPGGHDPSPGDDARTEQLRAELLRQLTGWRALLRRWSPDMLLYRLVRWRWNRRIRRDHEEAVVMLVGLLSWLAVQRPGAVRSLLFTGDLLEIDTPRRRYRLRFEDAPEPAVPEED